MKSHYLKFTMLLFASLAITTSLTAQKSKQKTKAESISLTADKWKFDPAKVEFVSYKNVPSIKMQQGGKAELKDFIFTNGTIEFDTEPGNGPFVTMYFRYRDQKESECFYLRLSNEGSLQRNDAVQYAPFIDGVNLWDILPHYQGPALLKNKDWNHIKLIVSGKQLRAYVNDLAMPVLEIPKLEANVIEGTIAFEGFATFANIVVKPDATEGLSPDEGIDPTNHDANYIRHWALTAPNDLPRGRELFEGDFAKESTSWEKIVAERKGLINVTRKFGANTSRRYVWLKAKIKSSAQREVKVDLGFSDEVWVFVNGNITHADKNLYLKNMRKYPDGRLSIENTSFILPLKEGDNELLIGLANDFYGWGIIARLRDMKGIEFVKE
jgi:hypothetical protein